MVTNFTMAIIYSLVVFFMDLKVDLRICGCGAHLRCLGSYHNMTAVAAFPCLDLALFKDLSGFHILQYCMITRLAALLNSSDQIKLGSQSLEALLISGICELGIHVVPLVIPPPRLSRPSRTGYPHACLPYHYLFFPSGSHRKTKAGLPAKATKPIIYK